MKKDKISKYRIEQYIQLRDRNILYFSYKILGPNSWLCENCGQSFEGEESSVYESIEDLPKIVDCISNIHETSISGTLKTSIWIEIYPHGLNKVKCCHNCSFEPINSKLCYDFFDEVPDFMQKKIYSHGLMAFGYCDNAYLNAEGIIKNPNWEICCSLHNENIGWCGIYVTGEVIMASRIDMYTEKGDNGSRLCSSKYIPFIDEYDYEDEIKGNNKLHTHCEIVIRKCIVKGFWVKEHCYQAVKDDMYELAGRLGVKLKVIK